MAVKEQLGDPQRSHMLGDSTDRDKAEKLECFLKKIDEIIECKRQVTLILDDPAGNSYIQVNITVTTHLQFNVNVVNYFRA